MRTGKITEQKRAAAGVTAGEPLRLDRAAEHLRQCVVETPVMPAGRVAGEQDGALVSAADDLGKVGEQGRQVLAMHDMFARANASGAVARVAP